MLSDAKALFEFVNEWMRDRQDHTQVEYEHYTRQLGALPGFNNPQREALKNFAKFGIDRGFPVDTNKHRDGYVRLERSPFRAYRPENPSLPWTLWNTADGEQTVTAESWHKGGMVHGHTELPKLLWARHESFSTHERDWGTIQVINPSGFLTSMEVLWFRKLEVLQWGLGVSV